MLGAALFGPRWGSIAQLAGSRTVSLGIGSIALRWHWMCHRCGILTLPISDPSQAQDCESRWDELASDNPSISLLLSLSEEGLLGLRAKLRGAVSALVDESGQQQGTRGIAIAIGLI